MKFDLGILLGVLVILLIGHTFAPRPILNANAVPVESSWALSVARFLRNNRFLRTAYSWVFDRAAPVGFALVLVGAGALLLNRALFDGLSAAGVFCTRSVGLQAHPLDGSETKAGFGTDKVCWPSGIVLGEGRRYRITLQTEGDWFDRTTRTDVAGFAADNWTHVSATPLKRWWGQNWFKPIARIGDIGSDEYVLQPPKRFADYLYPPCPWVERKTTSNDVRAKIRAAAAQALMSCAPTPLERRTLVSEIVPRTTGELFLYVNDAVLMWPGRVDQYFSNNSGTATVTVERVR